MKADKRKLAVRYLMILALFPIAVMVSEVYYTYQQVQSINNKQSYVVSRIESRKWDMIENTIEENEQKAKLQVDAVKDKISAEILIAYGSDMDKLKIDLSDKNDSPVFTIFNKNISNKYLNVNSDNNRLFIADKTGIIADKGIVSSEKKSRDWDTEINSKLNQNLASKAVSMILIKDKHIIYWTPDVIDPETAADKESYPSMEYIKAAYNQYGIDALKNYDVLVPSYITESGDIFGIPDVDNHGYRLSNQKIIVVQEFNIYDAIQAHMDDINRYNDSISNFKESSKESVNSIVQSFMLILILTFFSTIAMLYGANLIIKWGGDDDSND